MRGMVNVYFLKVKCNIVNYLSVEQLQVCCDLLCLLLALSFLVSAILCFLYVHVFCVRCHNKH